MATETQGPVRVTARGARPFVEVVRHGQRVDITVDDGHNASFRLFIQVQLDEVLDFEASGKTYSAVDPKRS